jgi:hypothetical protein
MAIDYFIIRFREDRHPEAELADAGSDLIDGLVVFAWITFVGPEPFDGPVFDAEPGEGGWILRRLAAEN